MVKARSQNRNVTVQINQLVSLINSGAEANILQLFRNYSCHEEEAENEPNGETVQLFEIDEQASEEERKLGVDKPRKNQLQLYTTSNRVLYNKKRLTRYYWNLWYEQN